MLSEQTFLKTNDGTQLHLEYREKGSPVWLIATHGIGEHLGRHRYLPDLFSHEFNVFQYDLRAHGRSSGDRSFVPDFNAFERDLSEIIDYLKRKYKMQRYVLFGHSMGALITAQYIQNLKKDELAPEMVILNAPPVGFTGPLGGVIKYTSSSFWQGLSRLPLSVRLKGLVDLDALSHYQEVRLSYEADELNCLSLNSNLVLGMVKTSKSVFSRPLRSPCPSYVSVGSDDRIVDVKALVDYFTMVDKSFKLEIFEGAYHEIHNEIDKYRKPYLEYLKSLLYEVRYKN
jgi:alpha-beta hydrolase superfamily lysophospholipase